MAGAFDGVIAPFAYTIDARCGGIDGLGVRGDNAFRLSVGGSSGANNITTTGTGITYQNNVGGTFTGTGGVFTFNREIAQYGYGYGVPVRITARLVEQTWSFTFPSWNVIATTPSAPVHFIMGSTVLVSNSITVPPDTTGSPLRYTYYVELMQVECPWILP